MVIGVPAPLRSPSLYVVASSINDNYWFPATHVQLPVKSEGMDQVRSKRTVNLHVGLAHCVTGLLQKK